MKAMHMKPMQIVAIHYSFLLIVIVTYFEITFSCYVLSEEITELLLGNLLSLEFENVGKSK